MARAAVASLEGVDRIIMSGTRATFTMKPGASVSKDAVAAAIEKNKLKFEGFSSETRPRTRAAYALAVEGLG